MSADDKAQIDKFRAAACELEADESEEAFDRTLRKIVKPPPKKGKDDNTKPGQ